MITLQQLTNRRYDGKDPVHFEYTLVSGDTETDPVEMLFAFSREDKDSNVWTMETRFGRTAVADAQFYLIRFEMPKRNLPLELICATGLQYFKVQIQYEVQTRSMLLFDMSNVLEGM